MVVFEEDVYTAEPVLQDHPIWAKKMWFHSFRQVVFGDRFIYTEI